MSKIIAAFITTFKLSIHPVPWTEDLRPRTGVTGVIFYLKMILADGTEIGLGVALWILERNGLVG